MVFKLEKDFSSGGVTISDELFKALINDGRIEVTFPPSSTLPEVGETNTIHSDGGQEKLVRVEQVLGLGDDGGKVVYRLKDNKGDNK